MPLLGFDKRFASKVRSGAKTCTIRVPRKRPIKVGDRLYLYTGLRTKGARKLGEGIVTGVTRLVREYALLWLLRLDGFPEPLQLHWTAGLEIAKRDGFDTFNEFDRFFDRYPTPTELRLIVWRRVKKGGK